MTGAKIRETAQLMTNVVIHPSASLRFINEAISKMVEQESGAGRLEHEEIQVTDTDEVYELQKDLLRLEKITHERDGEISKKHCVILGNGVKFPLKGKHTVSYWTYPSEVIDEETKLEMARPFHHAIACYVAYKESLRLYGSTHNDTTMFLSMYHAEFMNATARLKRQKPRYIKPYFS